MVCLLALALTLGVGAAAAQSGEDEGADDGAAEALEIVPVVVDYRTCLALTEAGGGGHGVASANGAAYQPGVDVHGRPVVPAEGPGGAAAWSPVGETLVLDLTIDLVERYGQRVPPGTSLPLGTVEVRDGRVWINGQPVAGHDREVLRESCRRLGALQGVVETGKPRP